VDALLEPLNISCASDAVDSLAALGDIRLEHATKGAPWAVTLTAPALVELAPGELALLGAVEGALPATLAREIQTVGPLRRVRCDDPARLRALATRLDEHGVARLRREAWLGQPERTDAAALLSQIPTDPSPPGAPLEAYQAFDPRTPPEHFLKRFRPGGLAEVLETFGWAVARRQGPYGGTERFFFRWREGQRRRAILESVEGTDLALRAAAACARLYGNAFRGYLDEHNDEVHLYFPPPSWLRRWMLLGEPVPPQRGSLVGVRLVRPEERRALVGWLRDLLYCDFV
jgi:hypothetical protein